MNIYVGNVPYAATEEDLKTLFSEYGPVATATIIRDRSDGRSKGFGFVQMENREDGERAIEALDGQDMMGRPLKVNPARPRPEPPNNIDDNRRKNGREENSDSLETRPQGDEEKIHLILTVGTNALPVWVAWYHLKKPLSNPKVGFVYTQETEKAMRCLSKYCKDAECFEIPPTEAGNPSAVRTTVTNQLDHQLNGESIHVHYTGGTQVMGVETVSTIATKRKTVQRSYLDARSKLKPRVLDRNGTEIGPKDAREGIDPDIEKIADLNGFEVKSEKCGAPKSEFKRTAWCALENTLENIAQVNPNKKNYKIFHDVVIKPKDSKSTFSFDLVAVLGYQVIVVCCKPNEKSDGNQTHDDIKVPAIRMYHQAKQLGGDEARAVMLCELEGKSANDLQDELDLDIGSEDAPLQVWGADTAGRLHNKFTDYLQNDLGWGSPSAEKKEQPNGHEERKTFSFSMDTVAASKKKYLVFTVGTNALPVWVAWCHLKCDWELDDLTVGFVYTEKTRKRMERLKYYFKCSGASSFLYLSLSEPGNPKVIGDSINTMLEKLPRDTSNIHVHYTGGTQVMGVETVSTIATKRKTVQRSYLDARSKLKPRVLDRNGTEIGPKDAREGIDPDIEKIADLNGFEVSGNQGFTSNVTNFACDNLDEEDKEKLRKASEILNGNSGHKRSFSPGIWLEYAALGALKRALEQIKHDASDQKRDNYALFRGVYIRRKEGNSGSKHFEVDVIVILGYQVVVVSCTTTNEKRIVRRKAVEGYLRARQLGGDEARTIVLCSLNDQMRQKLENELKDDTGSKDVPLQVWGKETWPNLSKKFCEYLRGLGWE